MQSEAIHLYFFERFNFTLANTKLDKTSVKTSQTTRHSIQIMFSIHTDIFTRNRYIHQVREKILAVGVTLTNVEKIFHTANEIAAFLLSAEVFLFSQERMAFVVVAGKTFIHIKDFI